MAKLDNGLDQHITLRTRRHLRNKGTVDFDYINGKAPQVTEGREACAKVVQGNAEPVSPELLQ
ncbi:hypothetical protein D3C75_1331840 [compost metagenome]